MISIAEIEKNYTPEMGLTILICRVYLGKAKGNELQDFITNVKINWQLFERIIAAHQIRPLIYKVLATYPSGVDPVVIEKLRKNCFLIARDNLQKLEELTRLNKLFSEHRIKNIPYKGVILSRFLFGDFISRETADIDFIIDPEDFPKVYELLIKEGYQPRYYNPEYERQILRTSHELMFYKTIPGGMLKTEIHWAVTNRMMNIPLPNADVFQKPETIKLPGGDTVIFNLQTHLLVLLVHHGVNDIWRTLRHNLDVSIFLEKYQSEIDWDTFRNATIKYKIRHTAETGFYISNQLFGTEIPEMFQGDLSGVETILQNLLRFPTIKKRKLNFENLLQQLFLRDSFMDKLSLLLSYTHAGLTPNVRDMEAYPIAKKWYPLYYLVKPYRVLFRKRGK